MKLASLPALDVGGDQVSVLAGLGGRRVQLEARQRRHDLVHLLVLLADLLQNLKNHNITENSTPAERRNVELNPFRATQ